MGPRASKVVLMYQCGTTGTKTLLLVLNHLRQLTYTNTTTPAINTKSINVGQHGTDSYHTSATTSTKTTILAFLTSRAGRIPMRLEGILVLFLLVSSGLSATTGTETTHRHISNVGLHGTDTATTCTKTTILAFLTSRAGRIPMRLEGDGEVSYLPTRLPRTSYIIL